MRLSSRRNSSCYNIKSKNSQMGFNIKNNYGPNIDNHDGGVIKLTMGRDGRWAADAEEAEIVEEVKTTDEDCDVEHQTSQTEVSTTRETVSPLSASRQAILDELLALADKGEWTRGVTGDDIKAMLRQVLEQSDVMWQLLERGRGDRLRVVWQNLTGYFVDRRLLPTSIGAPALNKMFFGDDNGYTNIDKGRPSKGLMTADFGSLVPLLDKYVPRVDKKA